MNKKSIASIASILFVLLITVTTCTLFLTPSPSYAEEGSVCWDCFDWGHGFRECGMTYSGAAECSHASGECRIWGMCIIVY